MLQSIKALMLIIAYRITRLLFVLFFDHDSFLPKLYVFSHFYEFDFVLISISSKKFSILL